MRDVWVVCLWFWPREAGSNEVFVRSDVRYGRVLIWGGGPSGEGQKSTKRSSGDVGGAVQSGGWLRTNNACFTRRQISTELHVKGRVLCMLCFRDLCRPIKSVSAGDGAKHNAISLPDKSICSRWEKAAW